MRTFMRHVAHLSTLGCALILSGCVTETVATPTVAPVEAERVGSSDAAVRPAPYRPIEDLVPLPDHPQPLFAAGDTNALELPVDAPLAEAYRAYFAGDGEAALAALDRAEAESPLKAFHLAAQRVRTQIMMGRAAEAEAAYPDLAEKERAALGFDVNALALRAEARLWLGDYRGAERDALAVADRLSGWLLPADYGGAPTNMAEIVLLTTAQLRAYTVLAGLYVLQGDGAAALPWAEAGERGYNTVHAVAADSLYGIYFKAYPESFYGRAFNKLFEATAKALSTRDFAAGAADFASARSYFDAIGYRAGAVSAAALESWTLYTLDQDRDRALAVSEAAVQQAIYFRFPDFVWRISALRGEMLLDEGRDEEAEAAFRRADASVDIVTGALSTDRAKLRYGVGKGTIAYRLAQFDLEKGDPAQLFEDLERARARAFVDMLADRVVAPGRSADLVAEIRRLDDAIRRSRIRGLAPRPDDVDPGALDRLVERRAEAVAALARRDPDLAQVHAAAVATLGEIRLSLRSEDTLAYALPARGMDPVRLLIATRDGARVYETALTADALRAQIVRFREAVQLGRGASQVRLAEQIARLLGFSDWRPTGRLYVVPSGDFFFMPWGALPDVGQTLVLPNGGWLLRRTAGIDGDAVGLIGDPEFGGVMPQLEGAREEVRALGGLLGTDPLTAAQATRAALRARVGTGASVLHFATHGTFDAAAPMRSSLVLSDGRRADPVTAADLFADPFPADLVVLSACETGMGEAVAGDDFLGLARSFYLGGARTVVNSLWPVSDEGTRLFMEHFHAEAARTGDYAAAWLAARNVSKEAGFPPAVYGAFVVGGAAAR